MTKSMNSKELICERQPYIELLNHLSEVENRLKKAMEGNTRLLLEGQARMLNFLERMIVVNRVPEDAATTIQRMRSEEEEYREFSLHRGMEDDLSQVNQSRLPNISSHRELSPSVSECNNENFAKELYQAQDSKMEFDYNSSQRNIVVQYDVDSQQEGREKEQRAVNGIDSQQILAQLEQQFNSMGLSFSKLQTLYEYPRMGRQNYMERILNKDNILIVMHLTTNQIVGAFTHLNFSSKPVLIPRDNPKAFLFNLTNKHSLFPSRTNKTHARDTNYLTFGSWEIKLKVGELEFESELGTKADCYRKKAFRGEEVERRREWLFGEDAELKRFTIEQMGIYILS